MFKMKVPPDVTGYSADAGETVIATQLQGGAPRVRLDQLGAVFKVNIQWIVGPSDYDYLCAFYRTGTYSGSIPFQIDLIGIERSAVTTYAAIIVPNTWKLASQQGLTYVVTCSVWAIPTITGTPTCNDRAVLTALVAPLNQNIAWSFASTLTTAGNAGNGSSVGDLCSGDVYQSAGSPLSQNTFGFIWSNFVMPTLPVGATIIAMKPVLVASDLTPGGSSTAVYGVVGTGLSFGAYAGLHGSVTETFFSNNPSSDTYEGTSIGTTSGDLSAINMAAYSADSVGGAVTPQEHLQVSFVGIAVFYE